MEKPDYIKEIEKVEGILSETKLDIPIEDISKLDLNKNLEVVYVENLFSEDNQLSTVAKLYKTPAGFYIYCKKIIFNYCISVYHKPEKVKEILIFLRQINKK